MKRCPTCNRTYTDDALSFCLDDGALLVSAGGGQANFDPNATLAYPAARDTSGEPTQYFQPTVPQQQPQATAPPPQQQPMWSPMPQVPPQRPKKSSPLPWILGVVAVLLVLGIGAVVLLSMAGGTKNANNANNSNGNRHTANNSNNTNNSNPNGNANNTNNSNGVTANNDGNSNSSTASFFDDFSTEKWGTGPRAFGSFYSGGEYHMHHTTADQFVVIYSPNEESYKTDGATVRVTTRSVDGKIPDAGYGLVVHGDLVEGKLQGYAFLIRNTPDPQYAVMMLENGEQSTLVKPTRISAIRTGMTPNQLEVRASGSQLSFYINGQYATSISDTEEFGDTDGRVGFYTSTGGEVAFDDLEVKR